LQIHFTALYACGWHLTRSANCLQYYSSDAGNKFISYRERDPSHFIQHSKTHRKYFTRTTGFGIIKPRKAILKVLQKETIVKSYSSPLINDEKKTIEFYTENTCAAQNVLLMEPANNGLWKIEIPMLPWKISL